MASTAFQALCLDGLAQMVCVQGYLGHEKQCPPKTLQQDNASGPMAAIRGGAVSYERGTHVRETPCLLGHMHLAQERGPHSWPIYGAAVVRGGWASPHEPHEVPS